MIRQATDYDRFKESSARSRRLLREEELILDVTEVLTECLHKRGITQTELATRLGKSKGFVSQVLAGGRNLTLRTVADIADALDCSAIIRLAGREELSRMRFAAPVRGGMSEIVRLGSQYTWRPSKAVRGSAKRMPLGTVTLGAA